MRGMMTKWAALALLVALCGCGPSPSAGVQTVGVVVPVRGGVSVAERAALAETRLGKGGDVRTDADGMARLILDHGPRLLLDHDTSLRVDAEGVITVESGRVFVEAPGRDQAQLNVGDTRLRVTDASFSLSASDTAKSAYVVRGELAYRKGDAQGVTHTGETLRFDGDSVASQPTGLWDDWTGGLALPGPTSAAGGAGVGLLEGRLPDAHGQARWPLVVRSLDVRVTIVDDLAITDVVQTFFNPATETLEGFYRIEVPEGAALHRFAVDRDGRLVDGYIKEKQRARADYDRQVYRGSTLDPALLEWVAPGRYKARIYPIQPGATRQIAIRYTEWLRRPDANGPRLYRYPIGAGADAPTIQELNFEVDLSDAEAGSLRASHGAEIDDERVLLRRSDFLPRSDIWLELGTEERDALTAYQAEHSPPPRDPAAGAAPEEEESDYVLVPLRLPDDLFSAPRAGIDLVIVADLSAGTERSHLELGRATVEALAAHLRSADRIAVVGADLGLRRLTGGAEDALESASPEYVQTLLDALARAPSGGASDLGASIEAAAELLDPSRPGAVVYVGDAMPTVGELSATGLVEKLRRLPSPIRLYGLGIGEDADLGMLTAVTRGAGLSLRVEDRREAARAALDILAHARRPAAHRIEVDLGTGVDRVYPRDAGSVVQGESFMIVGRVQTDLPGSLTVRGEVGGEPFERELELDAREIEDRGDLRLRWAGARLAQLMRDGAQREEVADLGSRYGIITPFTSFYVPSAAELSSLGLDAAHLIRADRFAVAGESGSASSIWMAPAFPFLALAGCNSSSEPQAVTSQYVDAEEEPSMRRGGEEGMMGDESAARTENRYAIEGAAEPDREMAGEAAPGPAAEPPRGVREALADMAGGWNGPTSPYGSDKAPGGSPGDSVARRSGSPSRSARSSSMRSSTGARAVDPLPGATDQGLGGTGRGGGGTGEVTIGLGNLGSIGHGAGGGTGSGYGRGRGGLRGRSAGVPRIRAGNAEVRGSLSREVIRRVVRRHINEMRFCYEQELNERPDLEGRVTVRFIIAPDGNVQTSMVSATTMRNQRVENCIAGAVRRWSFPAPDGGGVVDVNYPFVFSVDGSGARARTSAGTPAQERITVTTTIHVGHRSRSCSPASRLVLEARRALWRERLARTGYPFEWSRVYQDARRDCELPGWRSRRAFLKVVIEHAGSVSRSLAFYELLARKADRNFVRREILSHVRSTDDLRLARSAFGTERVDSALIEQQLAGATDDAERIRILRERVEHLGGDLELSTRLLSMYEAAERMDDARRLAERLRKHPLVDAQTRTLIGEMYLRLGDEAEARRCFSEIVEFSPLDEMARRRLGDLYRAHGWFEEAYRQYQTLAELRPDFEDVALLLAQAAAGAGRIDEALRLEQGLSETAQPGDAMGSARTAILWSSVRLAALRKEAREAEDEERVATFLGRLRRGGILREAGDLRVTLTWSHPDARLGLWAGHPGLALTRPTDMAPEFGIEAFDVAEQESGVYRIDVRRAGADASAQALEATLTVVWREGQDDEEIEIIPLRFEGERAIHAFDLTADAIERNSAREEAGR